MKKLIGSCIFLLALLIFVIGGMSHISIGSIGIVKHMNGKITEIPQGYHWTGWGNAVQEYPTYTQSLVLSNDSHEGGNANQQWVIGTADQQELPVNTNLTWKVNIKDVATIYQSVGGKDISYIKQNIVKPTMKNVVNKITHKYSWNDTKGAKQADITAEIQTELGTELSRQGIKIGTFGFTHVGSPAGMAQSQQALATSELSIKKVQAEQQAAKISNQTKIMNAETEAKANQLLQQSITPALLQKMAIEKWNGQLSQVSGGANPFINLNLGK